MKILKEVGMSNENPGKAEWKEFHYGKRPKRAKVERWQLLDHGDIIITGPYGLCMYMQKETENDGRFHNFKIVPAPAGA
jgi:hypothetical protein